ncbi:DNA-protecting protein DprA [Acidobacteria bacterium ACD]|nr:MAG: DNA-protecting protein DprA [Acidobacteriota bacterium]MDL1950719.1 DNA-protecting protein DprA [Acidobacteria bacterium ACD]
MDLRTGLGWALLARGRTARALWRLLAATGRRPESVLALSLPEAVALAEEPAAIVAPLLSPGAVPGVDEQERRLRASGARLLGIGEPGYPALLVETPDPPPVLFVRGQLPPPGPMVAVVGSRRASRTGLEAARVISRGLAAAGVTVVSGFARGVDGAAHRAALEAGGSTVAVLGCGVDVCYPPEHEPLLPGLLARGAVLSELPMGAPPLAPHFPVRNRIIAGMVPLVLVVEAAERSGSLVTARLAAELGRDVAAVPGSVLSPGAAGSNALLKDGAILVRDADDVLAELPGLSPLPAGEPPASGTHALAARAGALGGDAEAVFSALDPDDPLDADALVGATGLPAARLSAALVLLELEGLAEALPGAVFVRRRDKT